VRLSRRRRSAGLSPSEVAALQGLLVIGDGERDLLEVLTPVQPFKGRQGLVAHRFA
jgi:hypothetical protein